MIFIFYFFVIILIFLGYKSFRGGIEYLNYFKREIDKPKSKFKPFASIIVPCRGFDEDLKENLFALFRQNYPNYEVVFVVDDEDDSAVSIIKELINRGNSETRRGREETEPQINTDERGFEEIDGTLKGQKADSFYVKNSSASPSLCGENSVSTKFVIAGKAENEGQKVHNLRQAILEVSNKSEVFVFVDSDARPDENWLENLVAPLEDENIGCATGYRWFIAKSNRFAPQLRSVWNASITSALGANTNTNFCWGGSTAIRREIFEKLEIREKWKGTLSDDFALTNALKKASLPIHFVPNCLTPTVEDCNFSELLEFTTRQMKITKVYSPNLWKVSLIGSFLFTAVFWIGIVLLFFVSGWHFWFILAALVSIVVFGVAKSWLRLNAVKLVLENYEDELNESFLWQITLWVITPAVYFYNSFCALLSNEIVWRGITYKLESPNETIVLRNE